MSRHEKEAIYDQLTGSEIDLLQRLGGTLPPGRTRDRRLAEAAALPQEQRLMIKLKDIVHAIYAGRPGPTPAPHPVADFRGFLQPEIKNVADFRACLAARFDKQELYCFTHQSVQDLLASITVGELLECLQMIDEHEANL